MGASIESQLLATIANLKADRLVMFMASLILNLTVCGRGAYGRAAGESSDSERIRILEGINELQETISGQLVGIIEGQGKKYPDDVFCQHVVQKARWYKLLDKLGWAIVASTRE